MLKIAICDRSTSDRHSLKEEIRVIMEQEYFEVLEFESGDGLINYLNNGQNVNVVFLEASGVDNDALETGHILNRKYPDISVVYIALSFFEGVYETQHEYVLLKPIHPVLLRRAMNKINAHRAARISLAVKERGSTSVISPDEIIYCERRNRRTCIITTDSEKMCNTPIKMLHDNLGNDFVITHNSFIVNMKYIKKIYNNYVELKTGMIIPVSRSKVAEVKSRINEFFIDS